MTTFRIFVSSPGDVVEERVITKRVIERLDAVLGPAVRLQPVFWEHEPLRASASFQEQLPLPAECDIVLVILWSRLGSRLPPHIKRSDGKPYQSGTEFEFENAIDSYRKRGLPDLLVYRKQARPVTPLDSESEVLERLRQKKALDSFLEHWFRGDDGSFKAAFHAFETVGDFEEILETHLRKLIEERLPQDAVARVARAEWRRGSPFRGLEAFHSEHAPVFFGRMDATGRVLDALRRQDAAGNPFVLVFGMSGCGKSSLVRAGVLPLLTQPGVIEGIGLWRQAVMRPADADGDLFAALAAALLREGALPELGADGTSPSQLADLLRCNPEGASPLIKGGLSQAAADLARNENLERQPAARLALLVDQLEEMFTTAGITRDAREQFVDALDALVRSGKVWVLATLRSDFYPRCAELPVLAALKEGAGQLDLLPPTRAEIGQMIRRPALMAGLDFEEDEPSGERLDDMLRDAASRNPEALPLLQFTLEELYRQRSEGGLLTLAAYRSLGGVEGALAQRAESVFSALPPDVQQELPAVLSALVSVGAGRGDAAARRRAPTDGFGERGLARRLVDAFVSARLFVTDRDDQGRAVVSLAHEALLDHWPRLQNWLSHNHELLRMRTRVSEATARWESAGRSSECLLASGRSLAEAAELQQAHEIELDEREREFLHASLARGRRAWWLKRAAVATVCVLAVAAGVAALVANQRRVEAEQAREESEAVTNFLSEMLASVDPTRHGKDARVRDVVDEASATIGRDLEGKPLIQSRLMDTMGRVYTELGEYESARPLLDKALATRTGILGEEHLDVAQSLFSEAGLLTAVGEYDRAMEMSTRALKIREERLGPDHPDVSSSLRQQASILVHTGDFRSAEPLFERALAIAERYYGPDHPVVASALNDLAGWHENMGDYPGSKEYHHRALQIRKKLFGPDHIDVGWSLNNLALAQSAGGEFDEARGNFERALAITGKELGPDHPGVASVLTNLAGVLLDVGDHQGALEMYGKALSIWQNAFGEDHPDVATGINNLANAKYKLGNYDEARALYEKALEIRERVLGPDHPDVAGDLNNYGVHLSQMGDLESARRHLERAVEINERALGPEHPRLATNLHNLADLIGNAGDIETAAAMFERALAIREKALGPDHPMVASTLNNLARFKANLGDLQAAEPLFARAADVFEKALGPEHPEVATALSNLGFIRMNLGRSAEAVPLFERALAIEEKSSGPEHPRLISSLVNLGLALDELKEPERARAYLERALTVAENALGPMHPAVTHPLNGLAIMAASSGEFVQAEKHFRRVLQIREHVYGSEHPQVASAIGNLARVLADSGRHDEARPQFERAIKLYGKIFGPGSPNVGQIYYSLANSVAEQGNRNEALELFRRSLACGDVNSFVYSDHDEEPLGHDPEFEAMVAEAKQRASSEG